MVVDVVGVSMRAGMRTVSGRLKIPSSSMISWSTAPVCSRSATAGALSVVSYSHSGVSRSTAVSALRVRSSVNGRVSSPPYRHVRSIMIAPCLRVQRKSNLAKRQTRAVLLSKLRWCSGRETSGEGLGVEHSGGWLGMCEWCPSTGTTVQTAGFDIVLACSSTRRYMYSSTAESMENIWFFVVQVCLGSDVFSVEQPRGINACRKGGREGCRVGVVKRPNVCHWRAADGEECCSSCASRDVYYDVQCGR
ncbi:hypothetical protein OH76DRAFT_1184058 [Lentinus brumalis]|uniref:Uncharacterized protein n=1 Tax=Lentinus brumalis TaxID=2498619 RepID=A0A371CU10_9APHY|nr:hypothetical protein OH76DRAFT_1184058 [Polyporus brumalis]